MLFSSMSFLIFFCLVFWGHYFVFERSETGQVLFLTLCSLFFYGFSDPSLTLLLILSLSVNGLCAYFLLKRKNGRRFLMVMALVFNLGLLVFFKYAYLLGCLFLDPEQNASVLTALRKIPLPIGISFFTFRAITLIVDGYRGEKKGFEKLVSENNFFKFQLDVWFYISFFPQLLAGPIAKANEFLDQINRKSVRQVPWYLVLKYLIIGFFLKNCIADNLSEATLYLSSTFIPRLPKIDLVLLLYGYSFQMFADFAGYTYLAMGFGKLLGYDSPPNFNFPYISQSVTEFWRRWHISLSSWLKNYLYIPLGGNRKGERRTYLNLILTMILGGLWHGAGWCYAIWGFAHGLFLALERMVMSFRKSTTEQRERPLWARLLLVFYAFNVVSVFWLLFKLPNFADVLLYFRALWSQPIYSDPAIGYVVILYSFPIVAYHAVRFFKAFETAPSMLIANPVAEACCLGFMLVLVFTNPGCPGNFIYFQF